MSQDQGDRTTRREFLRNAAVTAVAGAVASSVMPTTAEGMRRVIGANDRIHIGHIGLGTQGYGAHVRLLKQNAGPPTTDFPDSLNNNTAQIACSDLYGRRIARTKKELGLKDNQCYTDFRRLLDSKDVDAVVIATSDNWHAPITIAALQAGKHVYCEKPMCKTLEEAFYVYDTVKRTGKIFQVGSQGCTDPKYKAVAKLIKEGKVGHMVVAQGNYMRADNLVGEWNDYGEYDLDAGPQASGPAHVDWDTFRRDTKPAVWDPDRFFRWRKYWEYGSGLVGDLLPHKLHPLLIAMDIPQDGLRGFPVRVSSGGGLYVQKINPKTKKKDREVPDFINVSVDFGDVSLMVMSSCVNEEGWPDSIRGNKATVLFSGDSIVIKPERNYSDQIDASREQAPGNGEHIETHQRNWLDCIRTNGVPNANIELAIRVQTIITLAERAYRESKTFTFNPKTRKAVG